MSCPVKLGRESRIKLDGVVVARMTSFDISISNDMVDITSFGDEWNKFCRGMQGWTGSVAGHLDLDNTEQAAFVAAAENGTLVSGLTFWVDSTTYFASDLVADSEAGLYIDTYNVTTDNNSIVSFTMNLTGNGPLARYNS